MQGHDPEEAEPQQNGRLEAVFEFYNCEELLPFCHRILWLSNVKEALGYIPVSFHIEYDELRALVILHEELGKKMQKDSFDLRAKQSSDSKSGPK